MEECKLDIESVVKLDIAFLVALRFDAEEMATQDELLLSLLGSEVCLGHWSNTTSLSYFKQSLNYY